MRATVLVQPEPVEMTVHVSVEDVLAGLTDGQDEFTPEGFVIAVCNRIGEVLNRTPDEVIAKLSPEARQVIAKFLKQQSERFDVGGLFKAKPEGR